MNNNLEVELDFNFVRFIKFLKQNNVFSVAIAAILSERINEITNSFTNNIVLPIINRDGDGDGKKDISKIEDHQIKCLGITFETGKFLLALIKFIIVTYIIFIVSSIFKNFI
jgi:large-conductance mechanosensitive channel